LLKNQSRLAFLTPRDNKQAHTKEKPMGTQQKAKHYFGE
jgi:hypothetical protein